MDLLWELESVLELELELGPIYVYIYLYILNVEDRKMNKQKEIEKNEMSLFCSTGARQIWYNVPIISIDLFIIQMNFDQDGFYNKQ